MSNAPSKIEYNVGDVFTLDGIRLIDINSGISIDTYTSSPEEGYIFTESDEGVKKITISSSGYKSINFDVTVKNEVQLVLSGNYRTTFEYGEYFSLAGLIVTAGENGEVITDYTCNLNTENKLTTVGQITVVISKPGYFSASYEIRVMPFRKITVATLPNKTVYEVGDKFDSTGLIVRNELTQVVTDYTLSIEDGSTLKYPNDSLEVTVSKEGYASDSFVIKVNPSSTPQTVTKTLSIYYLNDTHGSYARLNLNSYYKNEAGLAYISSFIKNKRSKNPDNTLVLSGGDMFQGGYESNMTRGDIIIDAMNEIGFDAMALGNHEFDWGTSYLDKFSENLNCDIISANTFYSDRVTRPDFISPYTIIEKDGYKVGIVGGAEKNMNSSIVGSIGSQFYFPDPVGYVKAFARELRLTHNCDVILSVFHDAGYEVDSETQPTSFKELTDIDEETGRKYVDAMFFAHDHYRKSGVYNGVPYIEAASNATTIGEINLTLSGNNVVFDVTDYNYNLYNGFSECKTYDSSFTTIDNKYADLIQRGAEILTTLHKSYSRDEFTVLACEAMLWYVNSHKDEFGGNTVYFASHNTGGIRVSSLPEGDLTVRDFIKAFPFDNLLSIQTCTSTHLQNMRNSSYYKTAELDNIVYSNGYTKAVSINYITESSYARSYQTSYVNYDVTSQAAVMEYLSQGLHLI